MASDYTKNNPIHLAPALNATCTMADDLDCFDFSIEGRHICKLNRAELRALLRIGLAILEKLHELEGPIV